MARPLGRRPLGGLFAIVLLGILYHYAESAIIPTGGCSTQELSNDLRFYGLKREGERVALVYMENTRKHQVLLEGYKNTKYRLFMLHDLHVLVVRCKQGSGGAYECGFFIFENSKIISTTNTGYNARGWSFVPFLGSNDLESGLDMNRIFLVSKKKPQDKYEYTLYVSYNYKLVILHELPMNGQLQATNIADEAQNLAGCFDRNIQCFYDYATERIAQFRNDLTTLMVYNRLRFFTDGDNFLVDKFNEYKCYEKRTTYIAFLPYFSPYAERNDAPLVTQLNDLFNVKEKVCPGEDEFAEVDKHTKEYNDDDYDEEQEKRRFTFQTHACPPGGRALLAVFIVAIIIDVILTLLLIAQVIIMFIARRKMKLMGKKMPKKPWETQATEDCTTFMDQTMGVTEATTVGETTGYTTVAQ
uniref:Uncharacterized protein n=1 Tax=Panagrellus redivivus TaxID=6233 RepID=A0A7E4VZU0_PANRE